LGLFGDNFNLGGAQAQHILCTDLHGGAIHQEAKFSPLSSE
jgi:hypothetical protein